MTTWCIAMKSFYWNKRLDFSTKDKTVNHIFKILNNAWNGDIFQQEQKTEMYW